MRAATDSLTFDFAPLAHSHLPIVGAWLAQPHVARWYDSPQEALRRIERHLDESEIQCFLVRLDGRPIGYIQAYDPHAYQSHPYQDQPMDTRGIDQFIGEAAFVGRGHGPRFIDQFVLDLYDRGATRIVTDPHPTNAAAIRAYIKAG